MHLDWFVSQMMYHKYTRTTVYLSGCRSEVLRIRTVRINVCIRSNQHPELSYWSGLEKMAIIRINSVHRMYGIKYAANVIAVILIIILEFPNLLVSWLATISCVRSNELMDIHEPSHSSKLSADPVRQLP